MLAVRTKGIVLVLTGAILWGISGNAAHYLFQLHGFSPSWLVVVRLLMSAFLLLSFAYTKERQALWAIFTCRQSRRQLIVFGIFGMLGTQYTYFVTIEASNAATATILQYLAPAMIACYVTVRLRRLPTAREIAALILALLGTFSLVTHGNIYSLHISVSALWWGLLSALALAFYTVQPCQLLKKWGSPLVTGWGMMIGGIVISFIHPPYLFTGAWSPTAVAAVVFIILFGTVIAFYCYLESLRYISATEASLFACIEPLAASVLSVVWLHVPFETPDWLGALCVVGALAILSCNRHAS